MQRVVFFVYGVACHALFLVVYAWMAVFVGGFGFGLPRTLDDAPRSSIEKALLVDLALVAVFAVQHSVMARPGFKRVWTRMVPEPIERSTYVLASCVVMAVLMLVWKPVGGTVWTVTDPVGKWILYGLFAFGWLFVPAVSLLINHFDLFGTRQVWLYLTGRQYTHLRFGTPLVYRVVRHPLYVGWLTAFWATPHMTMAHLIFAIGMSVYILLAIPLEERDLIAAHGEAYADYRRRVGGLIPRIAGRLDVGVLADPTWWSWSLIIGLLSLHLAGSTGAILVGAMVCLALAGIDCIVRREGYRSMAVQIRVSYAAMLLAGLLPEMHWLHWVLLGGASIRVSIGYCLMHRALLLLPWNRPLLDGPLDLPRLFMDRPGPGGLLNFGRGLEGRTGGCGNARPLPRIITQASREYHNPLPAFDLSSRN